MSATMCLPALLWWLWFYFDNNFPTQARVEDPGWSSTVGCYPGSATPVLSTQMGVCWCDHLAPSGGSRHLAETRMPLKDYDQAGTSEHSGSRLKPSYTFHSRFGSSESGMKSHAALPDHWTENRNKRRESHHWFWFGHVTQWPGTLNRLYHQEPYIKQGLNLKISC